MYVAVLTFPDQDSHARYRICRGFIGDTVAHCRAVYPRPRGVSVP